MRATKAARNAQTTTPSNRSPSNRTPLSEVDHDRNNVGVHEDYLPAPTPGQPRKAARDRHHPYQRSGSFQMTAEEQILAQAAEAAAASPPRRSQGNPESADEEQQHNLRMRKQRKAAQSPSRTEKTRSTSQNTSPTYVIDNDASFDAENIGSVKPKSADRVPSQPGTLAKVRASRRQAADSPLRSKESAGVRKTSGRVGSAGVGVSVTATSTARKVSGTS
jgi:cell division cycle 14